MSGARLSSAGTHPGTRTAANRRTKVVTANAAWHAGEMVTAESFRLSAKDLAASAAWRLPHDFRRKLYLRAKPKTAEFFELMRNYDRFERPKLGLSVKSAEELGCLFIHIPKNGGTSIGRTLFGDFEGNHMPIATYQMIYDQSTFERLFKFGVSRNPYDRLLSAYRFFRNGADRIPHAGMSDKSLRPEIQIPVASYDDFEQFVLEWLTPINSRQHEHFRQQHRFACSPDGRLRLDYVGRFESMDESFAHIAERVGVDAALMHDRRTRLSADDVASYTEAYTPSMRKVVEDIYGKDLRIFDYHFGD